MAEGWSSSRPVDGFEARPSTSQPMAQPMHPNDLTNELEAIDLTSHSRSRPELGDLMRELHTIVDWQQLLFELGFEKHKISIIEKNCPSNVVGQKRDAFDQWLRETPNADWKAIIDALYNIDESTLASVLENKYTFKDPRPHLKDRCVASPSSRALIATKLVDEGLPCKAYLPKPDKGLKYHTLGLTRPIPNHYVVQHEFFAERIKDKLTDFFKSIERSESKGDFRVGIEARFGKVYWKLQPKSWRPRNCKELIKDTQRSSSCFNPEVQSSDIDCLIRAELKGNECCDKEIKGVPRVRITVEGAYKGNYIAVIDEQDNGTFALNAVYREGKTENKATLDVAIPGRKYDFRISDSCGILLSESDHKVSYRIARDITASMHRLPNRKLSMMLRGETTASDKKSSWKVDFIRQRVQRQYFWKPDKKWIVVLYDLDVFDATSNKTINLDEAPLNEAVEVPFNYSRKEVELWTQKILPREVNKTRPTREDIYYMESVGGIKLPYEEPQKPLEWTAEDVMAHFDEFVGDAFKIAKILDCGHP